MMELTNYMTLHINMNKVYILGINQLYAFTYKHE